MLWDKKEILILDTILTEEEGGVPCAIGEEDSVPTGSFVCL